MVLLIQKLNSRILKNISVSVLFTVIIVFLISVPNLISAQISFGVEDPLWKPQKDEVFLQEVSQEIFTEKPISSIAVFEGVCYAVKENKIFQLTDDILTGMSSSPSEVKKLISIDESFWALAADGMYRFKNGTWSQFDNRVFVDVCMHANALHAATAEEIYKLEKEDLVMLVCLFRKVISSLWVAIIIEKEFSMVSLPWLMR